ncbi:prenyltransferase/squalene oxidase repeat-containing protein [Aquibacillus rhizosphaerae]|uniref:Squalene cyclase C-terminal domain-containing protein n=1 Tax=Aquibacillus rhizosphaerae TaxID=3051431 RepID=A0ABT7L502_9BACI|nr:hypothetical protein [Aquibacillus sp. LR5S19]MDL4840275.1 hypothetical protein [Aquibacillus sp. LR5S19]
MSNYSNNLKEQFERMEVLFDDLFLWLAKQYEPKSGGFYYARSSIGEFSPDIESTSQALNILIRNGLIESIPVSMKRKMTQFYQSKQDPVTGYFYDEHPSMRNDEVMVHRAIGYAIGSLRKLGNNPLYELPFHSNHAPIYVKSPESYLEKWKSIDMSNSWRGCDLLATSCVYMSQMSKKDRQPFLNKAVKYLKSIQNQETGLWGEGSLYVRISGTFKLHTFYSRFELPMPNQELIYKSILTCLRTEQATDMCYIRNPINLLAYLDLKIPDEELLEIIEITISNMEKLKREDGGFSRESGNSPIAPNVAQVKSGEQYPNMPEPVPLSKGLYEGDMNASTQATLIRMQCYQLCGQEINPHKNANNFLKFLQQT